LFINARPEKNTNKLGIKISEKNNLACFSLVVQLDKNRCKSHDVE
jgi:hypothetical protein